MIRFERLIQQQLVVRQRLGNNGRRGSRAASRGARTDSCEHTWITSVFAPGAIARHGGDEAVLEASVAPESTVVEPSVIPVWTARTSKLFDCDVIGVIDRSDRTVGLVLESQRIQTPMKGRTDCPFKVMPQRLGPEGWQHQIVVVIASSYDFSDLRKP
jgi:hypothetical protein